MIDFEGHPFGIGDCSAINHRCTLCLYYHEVSVARPCRKCDWTTCYFVKQKVKL